MLTKKIIYGKNAVLAAIEQGIVVQLYTTAFHKVPPQHRARVQIVTVAELEQLCGNPNHQQLVAEIQEYQYYPWDEIAWERYPIVVMLDKVQDVHNFGAIIRTCVALDNVVIIVRKHQQAPVNATVWKTSAGCVAQAQIVEVANLGQALRKLQKAGYWVVSTAMEGQAVQSLPNDLKYVVVFGNEHDGVSASLGRHSDFYVSLTMKNAVDSYNLSVACGIVLYQLNQHLGLFK